MWNVCSWFAAVLPLVFISTSLGASSVQCSCPRIAADGEGNTSCSASESGGRCTIDFNLFGAESERRAADLLRKYGKTDVARPDPTLDPVRALAALSSNSSPELVDAILIYLVVSAGNQSVRSPASVPLESLAELVTQLRSDKLRKSIEMAFNRNALEQWSSISDEALRAKAVPFEVVGGTVVSPGCVEFTTKAGLWMMFKTSWSAARLGRRCGAEIKT